MPSVPSRHLKNAEAEVMKSKTIPFSDYNDEAAESAHQWAAQGAAGHSGAAMDRVFIRRHGVLAILYPAVDPCLPEFLDDRSEQPQERSMLEYYRRLMSAELSRYRNSGQLDERELRIMDAYYPNGSLRAIGKVEGISCERVRQIIEGLRFRAPLFSRWYQLKHQARKGKSLIRWGRRHGRRR